jgi:hypothetical protein
MTAIPSTTVYDILKHYFGPFIPSFNEKVIMGDLDYLPVEPQWFRNMAVYDPVLDPKCYRPNIFDCDDYVIYLRVKVSLHAANTPAISNPLAAGYIFTDLHAFNFCIDAANRVFILNTQSSQQEIMHPQSPNVCATFLGLTPSNTIKHIYL